MADSHKIKASPPWQWWAYLCQLQLLQSVECQEPLVSTQDGVGHRKLYHCADDKCNSCDHPHINGLEIRCLKMNQESVLSCHYLFKDISGRSNYNQSQYKLWEIVLTIYKYSSFRLKFLAALNALLTFDSCTCVIMRWITSALWLHFGVYPLRIAMLDGWV